MVLRESDHNGPNVLEETSVSAANVERHPRADVEGLRSILNSKMKRPWHGARPIPRARLELDCVTPATRFGARSISGHK